MSQNRRPISRRQFLERSGFVFCGLVGTSSGWLSACESHEVIPKISGGLRRFATPVGGPLDDEFYVRFGFPSTNPENPPELSPDTWSLAITGEVDNPVTVTWADIMAAAESESLTFLHTLRCVFDAPGLPLISNAYWRGVPLSRFIAQALPRASAVRLRITGADRFTANLTLSRVMDNVGDALSPEVPLVPVALVYELNGQPIPAVHGGPVRLVVSEKFGFKNIKFPSEIEVTAVDEPFGYYEVNLFDGSPITDAGNIAITSFFSGPVEGEGVPGPEVTFFGVAVNGPSGVERVDVSIDGGVFEPAEIIPFDEVMQDPVLFFGADTSAQRAELERLRETLVQTTDPAFAEDRPAVWSLWRFTKPLPRGDHRAHVRAVGSDGAEQSESDTVGDDGDSRIRRVRFTVT